MCFEGFKTACFLFENKAFETLNSDRCWVAVASEDRILAKFYQVMFIIFLHFILKSVNKFKTNLKTEIKKPF